jgi:hypothetical protein
MYTCISPKHYASIRVVPHHTTDRRETVEGILCQDHTPRGSDGHIRRKSLHMSDVIESLEWTVKSQGTYRTSLWEPCWNHVGAALEPRWNHVGTMLEPCWNRVQTMLEPCWNHVGTMLEPCWSQVGISKKLPTPSSDKLIGRSQFQHRNVGRN